MAVYNIFFFFLLPLLLYITIYQCYLYYCIIFKLHSIFIRFFFFFLNILRYLFAQIRLIFDPLTFNEGNEHFVCNSCDHRSDQAVTNGVLIQIDIRVVSEYYAIRLFYKNGNVFYYTSPSKFKTFHSFEIIFL